MEVSLKQKKTGVISLHPLPTLYNPARLYHSGP